METGLPDSVMVRLLEEKNEKLTQQLNDQDRIYRRDLVRAAVQTVKVYPWDKDPDTDDIYQRELGEIATTACDIADAVLAEVKRRENQND